MRRLFCITLILSTLSACGTYNTWGVHNGWGTSRADHSERVVVNEQQQNSQQEKTSNPAAKKPASAEAVRAFSDKQPSANLEETSLAIFADDLNEDTTAINNETAEDSTSIPPDEPQYTQEELDAAYFAERESKQARILGIIGIVLLIIPLVAIVGIALIISSLVIANRSFNSKYNTLEGLRIARNWRIINWVILGILMLPLVILGFVLLDLYGFF